MKKLICLALFAALLGCGGSSEPIKHETPTERPPQPTTGGGGGGGGQAGSQQSAESI
ncbi:MAG: hypothetical protein KDB03_09665 [Planctomycetales bacterium]|nr:hypothetical protein [Planctomycetales bacterium]